MALIARSITIDELDMQRLMIIEGDHAALCQHLVVLIDGDHVGQWHMQAERGNVGHHCATMGHLGQRTAR